MTRKKSAARRIADRAYAQALIKSAISDEALTARSATPAPKPPTSFRSNIGPGVGEAFVSGMGQGLKNMAGGVKNFAVGVTNFAVPGAAGVLSQLAPYKSVRDMGQEWLQQSAAGARNTAESFGQYVGLNNAFDKNWNYTGAQAPQHLAQHRQGIAQKYFSNPKDADLLYAYRGSNRASDGAAGMVPAVMTGQAAVNTAGKIPALARAGSAVNTAIQGNKYVDKGLQAASVATGMPLHPAALASGNLSGVSGASQMAQYMGVPLAATVLPESVSQRLADAQQYFPAVAADNAMRQIHPDAPEMVDYSLNPTAFTSSVLGAAASPPVMQALADYQTPKLEAQLAQQDADYQAYRDHVGQAFSEQSLRNQAARADNTDAATAAMFNDPAMINRMQHGAVPVDAATQMATAVSADPAEQQQLAADLSGNVAPLTQEVPAPAPEQVQAQTQTAQPNQANSASAPAEFKLPEDAPPEVRAQVDAGMKQVQALPDEDKATAAAALQKPDGPEAQALKQRGAQAAVTEAANDPSNPPPEDPQGYGQWVGGVMDKFQKMDSTSQIAMGLGLGLGLLGLINSLSGEGGMGSFLMSALGLGGAAIAGAGAGMFGDDGLRMYGQGMQALGGMMGMNVPQGQQDLSALLSGSLMNAANTAGGNPAEKLKQLEMLTSQPKERMIPLLMAMDPNNIKTQADAQRAYDNAVKMQQNLQGYGITAGRAQAVQDTIGNVASGVNALATKPVETLGNWAGQAADWAGSYFRPKTGSHHMGLNFKDIIEAGLAKQAAVNALTKAARCWAGYEPVPGKAPYSEDSCRPAGSKKKKKEEKKAASSVFKLNEKKPEEVVNGAKPSTEASKEVSVKRNDPAKKEDLRPEGALLPDSKKS